MNVEFERSIYYEGLSSDMKSRYEEKIKKCGQIDPYTIEDKDFSTDRKDFPEISLWDIGNHLIYSLSPFTKKQFKAYKSTEGYAFFESGFVLFIGSKKLENVAIVKGRVKHSQRMNEKPLEAWLISKMDGDIAGAHCTCIAGLSETCSHVAALLFTVEVITKSTQTASPTDLLCKWNVPKFKQVSMSKIKDIKWTSSCYEEPGNSTGKAKSSFYNYYSTLSHLSDEVILRFINDLHNEGHEVALRTIIYPDEVHRTSKINDNLFLANLFQEEHTNKTHSELVQIGKSKPLTISELDIKEIARLTSSNVKSKIFISLRRGRVTELNFKDCCVTSVDDPSITTVNRLINHFSPFGNVPSVKYQKKHQKKAIDHYLNYARLNHENFKYRKSGLKINPAYPYFASSSDGLIACDCHGKGCIEMKCPKILESGEPFDILTLKPDNILNNIDGQFSLDKNHYYFYEAQMQIHVFDVEYCEVIIWSPKEALSLRINRDFKFWEFSKEKALEFQREVVMPELLGKFYTEPKGQQFPKENDEEYLQLIDLQIEPIASENE